METARAAFVLGLAALVAPGCIGSSTLAAGDRAVKTDAVALEWRPAVAADLPGLWRTRSIEGPAAAVLLDLSYWIGAEGQFSGAALFAGPPPEFQVLSGSWLLAEDGTLLLGEDSVPAKAEMAEGLLRLTGDEGSLILERAAGR